MPKCKDIKKVLLIGSGPIIIGQAAEFDYAGTQACRVLQEEGVEIVLINSNPATIMTDHSMADHIYIEPLTITTVKRIIEKEKPDSILSGLGGQTALTLCMQLAKEGYLEKMNVRLLGSLPETIDRAEDRKMFKEAMEKIEQPVIPSVIATTVEEALDFADKNGYPLIIRPAFTLGGTGGGIVEKEEELKKIVRNGLSASPIGQILVERSVAGWKEVEYEVMRDHIGNIITVCSMENIDPVGIHTGDSIVVAPTLTLADKEYQMLRAAAFAIIEELGVEGGCNCQFALNPDTFDYAVIEVNPRVSRSSALASKATGYPIAKVATKIALGYTLDEIPNAVTGKTFAAFEPALDYVALKFPKWPFDKFVYAKKTLGTQMKATGEVMSISDSFEGALRKAIRGTEGARKKLGTSDLPKDSKEELLAKLAFPTDERIFILYEALQRGYDIEEIHRITKIDRYFLQKIKETQEERPEGDTTYRMVDTCAGEFEAQTPYFYGVTNGTDEAKAFVEKSEKERVIVIGSGPIRIGQGIEFDYACVRCVSTLKEMGYDAIVINNNPETVSTDFDISDRLYFEPLTIEDVMDVIAVENPLGVVVAFGGGTSVKLATELAKRGVKILGSSADTIDICEDRERFEATLEKLGVNRPKGYSVLNEKEALEAAESLGFPVLMRPSYVLGGQNMIIAFNETDVREYAKIIYAQHQDNPVLVDKYLGGLEIEVDALCDGIDILIPGIMEHVERTGIHSGDSIAIYPPTHVSDAMREKIYDVTKKICLEIGAYGLINIQYIVLKEELYIIEVNPRASRTVPYLSKVTGIPMCDVATKISLGVTLKDLSYETGIFKEPPYFTVKVPVFSFAKLTDVDTQLGPEMKSTGEVLGIGRNFEEAIYKGLVAAGYTMKKTGTIFITVRDDDKNEIVKIAEKFVSMGFHLSATKGTAKTLENAGLIAKVIPKISENKEYNTKIALESEGFSYIISTSAKGRNPADDDVKIRRKASVLGIPCLTSIDTANALADSLLSGYNEENTELMDINDLPKE
jgi:carbamoyl-phosphate synthase large subunit